jgi:hypothetical protein
MITSARLIRWTGAAAAAAGALFAGIQPFHPPETLASVTTDAWAVIHYLTLAMALCGLLGITGIYARQANAAGWLGLVGYLLLGSFWLATTAFTFVEAFVLPLLAVDAPAFVEGYLGIFSGGASEAELGVLPSIAPVGGALYILGGSTLGVATFRAAILPRWAGVLLALGALSTLASALLPHPLDRLLAVPMGAALVWLGCALWFERRAGTP